MVLTRSDDGWMRSGCSLLWSTSLLSKAAKPREVVSIRQLFDMARHWPEELPSANGNALVVSGMEGCLDVLANTNAEQWVEGDLRELIFSFQDEYEGRAALIFWLPSGRNRISMIGSSEEYYWKHGAKGSAGLHLGRLLFSGAEREVERLLDPEEGSSDYDGKAWAGLHHPRIS